MRHKMPKRMRWKPRPLMRMQKQRPTKQLPMLTRPQRPRPTQKLRQMQRRKLMLTQQPPPLKRTQQPTRTKAVPASSRALAPVISAFAPMGAKAPFILSTAVWFAFRTTTKANRVYKSHAFPGRRRIDGGTWHNLKSHMRFNPYDDVLQQSVAASSVAIQSLTGSSAVNQGSIDTGTGFIAESIMVHVRSEIASGSPSAASVAWKLQESSDNSTFTDAADNTGTVIGATLNTKTVANDSYARVEGIGLNRKRYLRLVYTPTYTSGTSPATLVYGQFIGVPGSGQQLPVRTTVSNT